MARAVGLLARREYTRVELKRRLLRPSSFAPDRETTAEANAASPVLIENVLNRLQDLGLLSDARYASGLVRAGANRYGTARLAYELRRRGVDPDLVRETVGGLQATELDRARDVMRRRFPAKPNPEDPRERARQARFLTARGFGAEVIVRVLGSHSLHDEDQSP